MWDLFWGIIIICGIVSLVASVSALVLLTRIAREKGMKTDSLWFVGLCAPLGLIAVGLIVCAIPDKRAKKPPRSSTTNFRSYNHERV